MKIEALTTTGTVRRPGTSPIENNHRTPVGTSGLHVSYPGSLRLEAVILALNFDAVWQSIPDTDKNIMLDYWLVHHPSRNYPSIRLEDDYPLSDDGEPVPALCKGDGSSIRFGVATCRESTPGQVTSAIIAHELAHVLIAASIVSGIGSPGTSSRPCIDDELVIRQAMYQAGGHDTEEALACALAHQWGYPHSVFNRWLLKATPLQEITLQKSVIIKGG